MYINFIVYRVVKFVSIYPRIANNRIKSSGIMDRLPFEGICQLLALFCISVFIRLTQNWLPENWWFKKNQSDNKIYMISFRIVKASANHSIWTNGFFKSLFFVICRSLMRIQHDTRKNKAPNNSKMELLYFYLETILIFQRRYFHHTI
jgi:hypothetical protein